MTPVLVHKIIRAKSQLCCCNRFRRNNRFRREPEPARFRDLAENIPLGVCPHDSLAPLLAPKRRVSQWCQSLNTVCIRSPNRPGRSDRDRQRTIARDCARDECRSRPRSPGSVRAHRRRLYFCFSRSFFFPNILSQFSDHFFESTGRGLSPLPLMRSPPVRVYFLVLNRIATHIVPFGSVYIKSNMRTHTPQITNFLNQLVRPMSYLCSQ